MSTESPPPQPPPLGELARTPTEPERFRRLLAIIDSYPPESLNRRKWVVHALAFVQGEVQREQAQVALWAP